MYHSPRHPGKVDFAIEPVNLGDDLELHLAQGPLQRRSASEEFVLFFLLALLALPVDGRSGAVASLWLALR